MLKKVVPLIRSTLPRSIEALGSTKTSAGMALSFGATDGGLAFEGFGTTGNGQAPG